MHKRRLFIAINLPEELKEKLASYQNKWSDLDPQKIHWVKKDNLHITLVFIGYVTDGEMYEICNIVKEVAKRHQPFFIDLEKIVIGPPHATPRMFWAEGIKNQALANLQQDLEDAISNRNLAKKEARAFKPHITLARFKYEVAKMLTKNIEEPFKASIPVESIEVMESELRRGGAEYIVLDSVELGR